MKTAELNNILIFVFILALPNIAAFSLLLLSQEILVNKIVYAIIYTELCIVILRKTKCDVFHPGFQFLVLFTFFIGLGPIFLDIKGADHSIICALILLGLFMFYGGLYLGSIFLQKRKRGAYKRECYSRKKVLLFLYLIAFLCGVIYLSGYIEMFVAGDLDSARVNSYAGNGAILYLNSMLVIILPMLFEEYKKGSISLGFFAVLLIAGLGLLLLRGSRTGFLLVCLIMLLIAFREKGASLRSYVLAAMLVAFCAVGLLFLRNILSGVSTDFLSLILSQLTVSSKNLTYVLAAFPSSIDYQGGYTYLINLKMLLPGPDLDFTLWLKEVLGMNYAGGGLTPTIIGEFYLNFGVAGVAIGMFLYGLLGSILYLLLLNNTFYITYYCYIAFEYAYAVYGGIATVMIGVMLNTLVYLFIIYQKPEVIKRKNPLIERNKARLKVEPD